MTPVRSPKHPDHHDHAEYLANKRDYYQRTLARQHELQARARKQFPERSTGRYQVSLTRDADKTRAYGRMKAKEWRAKNPDRLKEHVKKSYENNRERILARGREYRAILRDQMLQAYGRVCACCGEDCPLFLTLDHIHEDGHLERPRQADGRRREFGGTSLYASLRKSGWPKGRYQVLCYNCNCAKGFFGQCPHQQMREAKRA